MNEAVVIGVGNDFRRDDGVGPYTIGLLKETLEAGGVMLSAAGGAGLSLMELWKGLPLAIVVDAVRAHDRPGAIYRFHPLREGIPRELCPFSTHSLNIAQMIELSRVLGAVPEQLIVYGVVGEDFGEGKGLSASVRRSAEEVAQRITKDIKTFLSNGRGCLSHDA
ncbi:MAG: hydrogenase maturation protease [Candidatus Omnitrophota bacterium]|nr:hydrogenase maturation protease [Candidatus Omnitrophota bacterium]MDZ4242841.1 hydrogenase maturation protease [Candidatus Omnitrophota bacterium]